jgi:hypothetical protein
MQRDPHSADHDRTRRRRSLDAWVVVWAIMQGCSGDAGPIATQGQPAAAGAPGQLTPPGAALPAAPANTPPADPGLGTGATGTAGTPGSIAPVAPPSTAVAPHDPTGGHPDDGLEHCRSGFAPDPGDQTMSGEPERYQGRGGTDVILPKQVRDWMTGLGMQESHNQWHFRRQWDSRCMKSNATPDECPFAADLVRRGLTRFPAQECSRPGPGETISDGDQFIWEHRHMIDAVTQAFPQHQALFSGFKRVPRSTDDPENPIPGHTINWSAGQLKALDILENIEQNADMFESDEYLAWYIQCRVLWTPQNPNGPSDNTNSGIHLAMHAQWAVFGSPSSVGDQAVSIENFAFWKLHGWVDQIWRRYRIAKGMPFEDDPAYKQGVFEQCKEMHDLTELREQHAQDPAMGAAQPTTPAMPTMPTRPETGLFAEKIRPFLDQRCSSCHGGTSPVASLVLGGVTGASSDIIQGLVNVDASNHEFKLVVPGQPMQSWLYLKASGESLSAACTSCVRDQMPPAGDKLSADQLALLRQWITDGATSQ